MCTFEDKSEISYLKELAGPSNIQIHSRPGSSGSHSQSVKLLCRHHE